MLVFAVFAFLLLLVSAHLVTRPFLFPTQEQPEAPDSTIETEKEKVLERIRELDMDFATGKFTEDDYLRLRAKDTAEAAELIRQINEKIAIDEAEEEMADLDDEQSPAFVDQSSSLDDQLEREIAARKAGLVAAGEESHV